MTENVRIATDTFNRFRRPDVEVRILNIHKNNAFIEFSGKLDKIDENIDFFREHLESTLNSSVKIEKIEKNTSCIVVFSIQGAHESEDDPLQKALKILDKYNEGVPAAGFGYED